MSVYYWLRSKNDNVVVVHSSVIFMHNYRSSMVFSVQTLIGLRGKFENKVEGRTF